MTNIPNQHEAHYSSRKVALATDPARYSTASSFPIVSSLRIDDLFRPSVETFASFRSERVEPDSLDITDIRSCHFQIQDRPSTQIVSKHYLEETIPEWVALPISAIFKRWETGCKGRRTLSRFAFPTTIRSSFALVIATLNLIFVSETQT